MERVLELLGSDSTEDYALAANLITPSLLNASPDQLKHKLKTRISALLKSSGAPRACGAVLARRALVDWSVVKSHGASWTVIMLHVLDLPDHVCWRPITRTLTYLFCKVHGKADLAREIAGSRIGDFAKRLVSTLPSTREFYAARQMLQSYPTQCRPYLNKLEPILQEHDPCSLGYLCLSEKQSAEVWAQRTNAVLDVLRSHHDKKLNETELAQNLAALESYIMVAQAINAKVPAKALLEVLDILLTSFSSAAVHFTCIFINATFNVLKPVYLQAFATLVYHLGDCIEMGTHEAVDSIGVITLLIESIGWVSENYYQLFTRLSKRALKLLASEVQVIGAEGLADFVQRPESFGVSVLKDDQREVLLRFLTAIVVYVAGIPQSCRTEVDRVILTKGSADQIALITLYPTKYSVLPLAIDRLPTLEGLETLVHPRFPPLNISKHLLEQQQLMQNGDELEEPRDAFEQPEPSSAEEQPEIIEEQQIEAEAEPVPLPAIPESHKPVHRPDLDTPPEKRAKVEPAELIEEVVEVAEPVPVPVEESDSDEEELVIPTLNMDSD